MNKSGKSNIIFIILIPLILVITLLVVDTIISYSTNKKFKIVTENIISDVMTNEEIDYEDYYNEIKRLYELQNYETDMLVVFADENKVIVNNEHKFFGLFTSITNPKGEMTEVNIFGAQFYVKKGSKTSIRVEASYDLKNEIVFEYEE